jgi:hypothetical protein
MLATSAQPFDGADYFFEVKWDGVRALAAVQGRQWRLWGRELADYTERYPGSADFSALMFRHRNKLWNCQDGIFGMDNRRGTPGRTEHEVRNPEHIRREYHAAKEA